MKKLPGLSGLHPDPGFSSSCAAGGRAEMHPGGRGTGALCADILRVACAVHCLGRGHGCGSGPSSTPCRGLSWLQSSTGGSRQLGAPGGGPGAFQPSLGAQQGPWVLFCEVPSRWRHGPQEPACPCAERWFLSCRPTFRGGESLQRERRESLLTSLRPLFLSPSLPQAQKITEGEERLAPGCCAAPPLPRPAPELEMWFIPGSDSAAGLL